MQAQVNKCYYHPETGAVATCAKCGVGICRECAVKDDRGRVLCYQCGNEDLRQEHKEYKKRLKESGGSFRTGKEFIVPGIVGILIAVVGAIVTHSGVISNQIDGVYVILVACSLFAAPFGYIMLNDLFAPKYGTAWNIMNNWLAKAMFSFVFGWIFFTFILVRFIVRKIRHKKTKPNI